MVCSTCLVCSQAREQKQFLRWEGAGHRPISETSNYGMIMKMISRGDLQHKAAKGTKKVKLFLHMA
jgi:hypothetical protein